MQRSEGCIQAGRSHNGVDDDVHVRMGGSLDENLRPAGPLPIVRHPRQPTVTRPPGIHLGDKLLAIATGSECDEPEVLPLAAEHIQSAASDRAGRSEKGDASPGL
jgi:hypothetical protein